MFVRISSFAFTRSCFPTEQALPGACRGGGKTLSYQLGNIKYFSTSIYVHWLWPPPNDSVRLRFTGICYETQHNPGGHWYWEGTPKVYTYIIYLCPDICIHTYSIYICILLCFNADGYEEHEHSLHSDKTPWTEQNCTNPGIIEKSQIAMGFQLFHNDRITEYVYIYICFG